jgi:hypothetical protein
MILENQKQIDDVKQYYEILRTRQQQIIEIIKDTSQLLSRIDSQPSGSGNGAPSNQKTEKNSDPGVRLAFSMINALANILDVQMQALNVSVRFLLEENPLARRASKAGYGFQDYYEITTN